MPEPILRVALPTPLRRTFDYLPPKDAGAECLLPGIRLRVPFGRQQLIGVLLEVADRSDWPSDKLKRARDLLDKKPLLPDDLRHLLRWASRYYQHSLGEVMQQALPVLLRQGEPAEPSLQRCWQLTEQGRQLEPQNLARAPRQLRTWQVLKREGRLFREQLDSFELTRAHLKPLADKGLAEEVPWQAPVQPWRDNACINVANRKVLNAEQAVVVATIGQQLDQYGSYLLEGVTGSGKTEVYLQLIEQMIAQGRQTLVLVPEIGLTPQTIARFRARFDAPIVVMHSGLNERERLAAWLSAARGDAAIVIGTRSAVFVPLLRPGIIVIDEEHDGSFKQQDSFRYHARDLAVMRAHRANIPVVLGSATPSLETLHNAQSGKYHHLHLRHRAAAATALQHYLIDLRHQPLDEGLAPALLQQMQRHLADGNQVLLFLNRRGFAPALLCHDCGWLGRCPRCEVNLTVHRRAGRVRCHHCGFDEPLVTTCPGCHSPQLVHVGQGTERLEQALARLFPDYATARIDRDSTRRKGELERLLGAIKAGEYQILLGTQMLAKGHHFPDVTLVALLDVDGALFSADFRAPERLAQQLLQVSGRAGRAEKPGQVYLQTHQPDHPLLQLLLAEGYPAFARSALAERQATALPPYAHLALLRAEAHNAEHALAFLQQAHDHLAERAPALMLIGPLPAPMERRAGRYRFQLLLHALQRSTLQQALEQSIADIEQLSSARRVRWSLDVDPQEMA